MHAGEGGIHLQNGLAFVDQSGDAESGLWKDAVPLVDLDLLGASPADIAKHQHHAKKLIPLVANRSAAVVDGDLPPLPAHQNGVVREVGDGSSLAGPVLTGLSTSARVSSFTM